MKSLLFILASTVFSVSAMASAGASATNLGCANPGLYQRFDTLEQARAVCSSFQTSKATVRVSYDYFYHQYVCVCDYTSTSGGNR
jgi:hypothetical protein